MVYRVLADLVVMVHLAFIAFVAVGAVMAWRWPRLLRVHVPAVAPLEKALRQRAGGAAYEAASSITT